MEMELEQGGGGILEELVLSPSCGEPHEYSRMFAVSEAGRKEELMTSRDVVYFSNPIN